MYNIKLTQRYIPALLLITVFLIISYFISENIIKSNNEYANIINISGKQRMLSQRLVILANDFLTNETSKEELLLRLKEMKNSHEYLKTKLFNEKIKNIYFKDNLDNNLNDYLQNYHLLIDTKSKTHLLKAMNSSRKILDQLDKVVKEHENYANEQLNELRSYELYLTITALFVLLLEAFFIFRPAAKKIEQYQNEMKKHHEDYENTLLETSNNAIIAIDWTGKITTYNQKAQEMFGWTKEEMIGQRNIGYLIPDDLKKLHEISSEKYLKNGFSSGIINKTHELRGLRKDGTIFPLRISIGGKWKFHKTIVVASISDISLEKKNEAILEQQSKLASMGDMIGNIAHQWRQPLSVISTAATGLQVKKEYGILEDEFLDKSLVEIEQSAQYLSTTIDTFRDFIKEKKEYKEVILQERINTALDIVKVSLTNNYIQLINNINKIEPIKIKLVVGELSEVIINIINNSKDAIKENEIDSPWIKIDIANETTKISITIEDNGGGIPDNILPRIFEPYFTTKHESQGTGLGLHMSYRIVTESLNGKIWAENTNDGVKFFIEIPK